MFANKLMGIAVMSLVIGAGSARADEEADKMMQEALPLMHHSCASVVDESNGDEDYIVDVVMKMTVVSIYNRGIDVAEYVKSDEDKEKLRDTFLAAVREGCEKDRDGLLAGVIDTAVKTTLGL